MKKIFALLLTLCLIVSLCACSGGTSVPTVSTPAQQPTPEISNDISEDSAVSEPTTSQEPTNETLGSFNKSATLEETVMYDENNVKITATGLEYDDYSVSLELLIENNSDKDLSFISGSLGYSCNSVNGYMFDDGYLNCDVAAGKKANDTIEFDYDGLMLYGIDEIADIEIGFEISDDDYNDIYSGPRQVKTSAYDSYDYTQNHYQATITSQAAMNTYNIEMIHFSDDLLYEENGVKIISSSVMTNKSGDTMLLLELENTTNEMVYITASNIALNGLIVSSSIWSTDALNPGKHGIIDVDISSVLDTEYWDAYGIEEIGSVSLSVRQRDSEGNDIVNAIPIEIVIPEANATFDSTGKEIYNKDGFKITAKTVVEDPSEYSGAMQCLLLAENSSGKTLTVDIVYDSLSINGYMADYSFYSKEIANGESAALKIELWESSLEDNNITSTSDINEIELSFELREGYNTYDQPTICISFADDSSVSDITEDASAANTGLRPEFKAAMDAYEAFYDEYCAVLKKYSDNPTDMSLLTEYTDIITKSVEVNSAFEEWNDGTLNSEELAYFLDVNNRVMQKLVAIAE